MSYRVLPYCFALCLVAACSREEPVAPGGESQPERVAAEAGANPERPAAAVDGERIVNADAEPGNWMSTGRTYDEQRFSPLDAIDTETVQDLGLAWYWNTGTVRGLEATPIVVDGVMYTTGTWSVVWAHDAKTGELLWSHDPQVPRRYAKYACCDVVNRGVAVWKGRVYSGVLDGRLIALDAATGELAWEVLTTDPELPYTITGAPRIVKDKVIIGNGGAEYGVRGYVTAYDTATGAEVWRFYTVPGDPSKPFESPAMETAASTWRGDRWWEIGGGGTVWDSMAYDPELNLLYIGVGNGSPWNRYVRSPGGGDNLYLSSIVAIDADDGGMAWFYQTTPGDSWDYTAVQHMILADIDIDGEHRKVIMQAPKNGFFYVLDRTNGEFISAEAYVPVTWATHIDPESGRPVENPAAHYTDDMRKIRPSPYGGHNWHPMTYHPDTGLVYIPALDMPFKFAQDNAFRVNAGEWNTGLDFGQTIPSKDPDTMLADVQDVKGHLAAWNPVEQREVWRVQHAMSWNGGLLSTAGNLVFQGLADGRFVAYAADTGELVWEYTVDTGIVAAPVSYAVDGEQYVAVVAGWGGAYGQASGVPRHRDNVLSQGRILAFKLGGNLELPELRVAYLEIPQPPDIATPPDQVAAGELLFHEFCSVCHGPGLSGSGALADLRYTTAATHELWNGILLDGTFIERGMPRFDNVLSVEDANALQAYVIDMTRQSIAFCQSEYRKNYPELLDTACTRAQVQGFGASD